MKQLAERIFVKAQQRGFVPKGQKLEFKCNPTFDDDVRVRVPSIKKAISKLNWKTTVLLDEALDRCIDEFLNRERSLLTSQRAQNSLKTIIGIFFRLYILLPPDL